MINAGMVFCDRHFGGINYPVGGVGRIPEEMADGVREKGGYVVYKANVRLIFPSKRCLKIADACSSATLIQVMEKPSLAHSQEAVPPRGTMLFPPLGAGDRHRGRGSLPKGSRCQAGRRPHFPREDGGFQRDAVGHV